ncbi:MAG TPA: FAD-dependent oxidoreductase [Streptosporangiaceae bacterium]|nr:FAD-dependent oxidoreductase [Streptosporangiaceae bacterium]
MASSGCDVLVVGAGVSGLTTGVCLAEGGRDVTIMAERPPSETTSSVAGALWGPHLVETSERVARWARETLGVFGQLATDEATGVRIVTGVEATRAAERSPPGPAWLTGIARFRRCRPADLPPGFARGWRYTAPLVHMPTYLDYLAARFEAAGGRMDSGKATSLPGAAHDYGASTVVNCTGAGAHDLVPDPALFPVRGQVVVADNPGLTDFFVGLGDEHPDSLVYVFPHSSGTVVLGGTEQPGDWNLAPSPAQARRILRACVAAEPRLAGVRVLAHQVGLRPCRPRVRLEAEPGQANGSANGSGGSAGQPPTPQHPLVVHNYGHGGAGVTLSWGCAREAARVVSSGLHC